MTRGLGLTVRDLVVLGERDRRLVAVPALDLEPGTCLGVRGPSGAGKSTLLFALAGLAGRTEGRVAWGGTDVLALSPSERARFRRERMGLVFQDFLLFDELSASANAALAAAYAPRVERRRIEAAARERLTALGVPAGERSVTSFSGGERQRVGVARAMAGDPAILLADEPTASLDRAAADAIVTDLLALVRERGVTLIAVSHDAAVIERMDRTLELDRGAVVAAHDARRAA